MFKAARENDFAIVHQNIAETEDSRREGLRKAYRGPTTGLVRTYLARREQVTRKRFDPKA